MNEGTVRTTGDASQVTPLWASSGLPPQRRQAASLPCIFSSPPHVRCIHTQWTDTSLRKEVTSLKLQQLGLQTRSPVLQTPEQQGHPLTPGTAGDTSGSLHQKQSASYGAAAGVTPTASAAAPQWLCASQQPCLSLGWCLRKAYTRPAVNCQNVHSERPSSVSHWSLTVFKKLGQEAISGGLIAVCDTLQGAAYGFPSQTLPSVPRSVNAFPKCMLTPGRVGSAAGRIAGLLPRQGHYALCASCQVLSPLVWKPLCIPKEMQPMCFWFIYT